MSYDEKFETFLDKTFYESLQESEQKSVKLLSTNYRFTFQEFRSFCEYSRDIQMWNETSLLDLCQNWENDFQSQWDIKKRKRELFSNIHNHMGRLKKAENKYSIKAQPKPERTIGKPVFQKSEKKIFGDCPVASPKTVCCNLKTIDAVEGCAFGCSYCTIQSFYGESPIFDADFGNKLKNLNLDPKRNYHIGTGQSSDALVWGNKNGILDDLCQFAVDNKNIILEFKTKSSNISFFKDKKIPKNIFCSWSLNTETMISNEEHYTASLEERFAAARAAANLGIKVAFHFHPMVHYEDSLEDYKNLINRVVENFTPEEVLFVSFGSVTFIKPVMQEIRKRGGESKILQMELVPDPHGKLTYPDEIKLALFHNAYKSFSEWHNKVFFYLCMERSFFWDEVFGEHYLTNDIFEKTMFESMSNKL